MEDAVDFTTRWEFIAERDTVACDRSAVFSRTRFISWDCGSVLLSNIPATREQMNAVGIELLMELKV